MFSSAFLLLAVQPLAAKRLLPVYGGSSSVWTVCLLFFQLVLLAGYAWAHAVRHKPLVHAAAAIIAAGSLYFFGSSVETSIASPMLGVLVGLAKTVGLPYFVLSATSPLLQAWTKEYRLYAFSNLGSLTGLIGFVFVLDRIESIRSIFVVAYLVFAALIVACCLAHPVAEDPPAPTDEKLSFEQVGLWMLLAMCGTGMLAATTNQLCQEVASIPLLWVWPLGLYLASFAICFESPRWYKRIWFGRLAAALIPAACIITSMGTNVPFWAHFLVDSAAFFVCLMLVHGELAERRPEEGFLTSFYLAVAAGGALGTLLVAFIAPRVFTSYLEFPLFLMLAGLSAVALWWRERLMAVTALLPLLLGALAPVAYLQPDRNDENIAEIRNFFGIARVSLKTDPRGQALVLTHGQTIHGSEYVAEKAHPRPSTYYTPRSGVGIAIGDHRHDDKPMDIGVIGLGTGTLASYAKPGDNWWFYDINPDIIRLAHQPFTYLKAASESDGAHVHVIEGDGRLSLAREPNLRFDILVVDAFSSDSIPVHLLTRECGSVYRSRLKDDGILAIHISNRTLDLEPVVRGLAQATGMSAVRINNDLDKNEGVSSSSWMLLSPSKSSLDGLRRASVPFEKRRPIIWRDGYADILDVISFDE
ncbi:MAG TPA: fused MFS/spermidine synthase [Bryobacteraceae bacterium]